MSKIFLSIIFVLLSFIYHPLATAQVTPQKAQPKMWPSEECTATQGGDGTRCFFNADPLMAWWVLNIHNIGTTPVVVKQWLGHTERENAKIWPGQSRQVRWFLPAFQSVWAVSEGNTEGKVKFKWEPFCGLAGC